MLTKREFAESIVASFCKDECIRREEAHAHIYKSGRLAVALEFLGELSEQEKEYSRTRGGMEYSYVVFDKNGEYQDIHFLTTREILDMLPEK